MKFKVSKKELVKNEICKTFLYLVILLMILSLFVDSLDQKYIFKMILSIVVIKYLYNSLIYGDDVIEIYVYSQKMYLERTRHYRWSSDIKYYYKIELHYFKEYTDKFVLHGNIEVTERKCVRRVYIS